MSSFFGMDVEGLQAVAIQMRALAKDLEHRAARINLSLSSLDWSGPDAVNYRRAWEAQYRSLTMAAFHLEESATVALRNAVEQERTSE